MPEAEYTTGQIMQTHLRPLSTGELLDKAFGMYRNHFLLFAGIAAIANVVPLLLSLFARFAGPMETVGSIVAALVAVLGSLLASALAQGATVYGVSAIHLGNSTTISDSFRQIKRKIGRIILINIGLGLIVGFGLILLIAPGLIWLTMYSLAIPAAVLENLGGNESLSRSKTLSQGGRGRIFAIYVLVFILQFSVGWVLAMIEQQFFRLLSHSATGTTLSAVLQIISRFGVDTLVYPLGTIAIVLVYYDQRVRKEAFDLEHLMQTMSMTSAAGA
jgi:hypothetical protein